MKLVLWMLVLKILFAGLVCACDFHIDPATFPHYYRDGGWKLPALDRGKLTAPLVFNGSRSPEIGLKFGPGFVRGLTARMIVNDASDSEPHVFEIPKQEFEQEGKRLVMSSQLMRVDKWIWRYDFDGKVVAYVVGLTPIEAHRVKERWKVDAEAACIFYATFIDDTGDGIFRLLVPGWMTPDLMPQWVLDRKRDPA